MTKANGINNITGLPYWKERRMKNKDKVKYIEKNSYLKTKYGITLEQYQNLITKQDGKCAICFTKVNLEPCGKGSSHSGFAIDHDHQTGQIRGLLCYKCNLALGHFRDNYVLVERALEYLIAGSVPTKASDIQGDVPEQLKDYTKLKIKKDRLLLTGDAFFKTLQGEGTTIGMPCIFARLHHCNLHCNFCDAYYSWKKESREFWIEPTSITFEEAALRISTLWIHPFTQEQHKPRVIWTGGEPLIQKTQIDEVVDLLGDRWVHEIETNGTLMPTQNQLDRFQFNCSPKLSNNVDDRKEMRIRPRILNTLNQVDTVFKFVCRDEKDLEEIERDYGSHISEDKILIMPEGVVSSILNHHARQLYEPVMKRGWKMTPRFQAIFADGARRGV